MECRNRHNSQIWTGTIWPTLDFKYIQFSSRHIGQQHRRATDRSPLHMMGLGSVQAVRRGCDRLQGRLAGYADKLRPAYRA